MAPLLSLDPAKGFLVSLLNRVLGLIPIVPVALALGWQHKAKT